MGIIRDLFYFTDRVGRAGGKVARLGVGVARQVGRDRRHSVGVNQQRAIQANRDELARELTAALYRILTELSRRNAIRPRHAHQDAKLAHHSVLESSSDRVSALFRRAPQRSVICFPYGVWLGLYATEGEFWVLIEVQGAVSCVARYADRLTAEHCWAALVAYCFQLNRIPQ